MIVAQTQPIFIQQRKMKPPVINPDTSINNQQDEVNQSMQQEGLNQTSNTNLIKDKAYIQNTPFMYVPVVNGRVEQDDKSNKSQEGEQTQIKCWQILFPQFNVRTVNFVYVVILTLYCIATFIYYYVGPSQLSGCTLYKLGAKFTPSIKHEKQVHRLIVSIPLFGSILQAIMSLLTFLMFGFILEQYIGRLKYAFIVFITGFFSNLLSGIAYPYYVTVGSIGSIFGIIALNISFIINKSTQLGHQKNLIISLFVMMIGANFLSMIDTNAIDIAGIVGGFVSGGLLSIYYYEQAVVTACFRRIQILSLFTLFGLTVSLFAIILTLKVENIDISEFCP